jgi:hypothetical protein
LENNRANDNENLVKKNNNILEDQIVIEQNQPSKVNELLNNIR